MQNHKYAAFVKEKIKLDLKSFNIRVSITKRHCILNCSCGFAIDLPCEKLYNANVSKKVVYICPSSIHCTGNVTVTLN